MGTRSRNRHDVKAYRHRLLTCPVCKIVDMHRGPTAIPVEIRFWRKVEKTDGCWLWTAAINKNGYGAFAPTPTQVKRAHRVSWELHYGPIPPKIDVCHECDTRNCVRPDHLFLGTRKQNMEDCKLKGRTAAGDRSPVRLHPDRIGFKRGLLNPSGKLTEAMIQDIVERRAKGTLLRVLSEEYGITFGGICNMIKRRHARLNK